MMHTGRFATLRRTITTAACLLLTAGGVSACGGGGAGSNAASGGEGTSGGEEVAAQYQGELTSTDVAGGETIYQQACAPCHDSGPALENIAWEAGRMRQQIREGSGQMPPIPAARLSDEDMENVLAYLKSIGGVSG